MKLTGKKFRAMLFCMMLTMTFIAVGCGNKKEEVQQNTEAVAATEESVAATEETVAATEEVETTENIESTEAIVLGEGSMKFTFVVVAGDGNETDFEISTDCETVGDALLEQNLIEGDDSEYGLYVKTVNGVTADYDTDGTYWAFYVNGEYAATGVDSTPVNDGDVYMFQVEK